MPGELKDLFSAVAGSTGSPETSQQGDWEHAFVQWNGQWLVVLKNGKQKNQPNPPPPPKL